MRILFPSSRPWQTLAGLVGLVSVAVGCYHDPVAAPAQLNESRRLAADLRAEFNKAADASDRAVMADTDEASIAFAREAEASLELAQRDVTALEPLLRGLHFPDETQLLQEFGKNFAQYRELDRGILKLAVENTNLKAQRLSFGPARQAADRFAEALKAIASAGPPGDRCRIEGLVAKAVVAVRTIEVLHAPHIAEANDAAMTKMEAEMAALDGSVSDAMKALGETLRSDARPAFDAAVAALAEFRNVAGQIVTLSRRNSNVRSLELSLRTKPALVAACDVKLRALQDALAKEGFKATR